MTNTMSVSNHLGEDKVSGYTCRFRVGLATFEILLVFLSRGMELPISLTPKRVTMPR